MTVTWQFEAMDSLFFRDSRPMNAGESAWIESMYPPTGRTLQGAIRSAILDFEGVDYKHYKDNAELLQQIGGANDLGNITLTGPWLSHSGVSCFPLPLDLVKNEQGEYALLTPSDEPLHCDLGRVRMPAIQQSGYKTQENRFITCDGMQQLLTANVDKDISTQIIKRIADTASEPALADREPKVGLARDNTTRTNRKSMLFAIAPIRPRPDTSLLINIEGLPPEKHPTEPFLQRLGGEGKLAHVKPVETPKLPAAPALRTISDDIVAFRIMLTTHALMPEEGWLPEGFQLTSQNGGSAQCWKGTVNGIAIDIISACIGKPFRQGGWDHANHQARPLQNYVPAGSVYFCQGQAADKDKISQWHGSKIGSETEYGFGHFLIGRW